MNELIQSLETVEPHALQTAMTQRLHQRFSDRVIYATQESLFQVGPWAAATKEAVVEHPSGPTTVRALDGSKGDVQLYLWSGHERFEWRGATFDVVTLQVPGEYRTVRWSWLLAPGYADAAALFGEVVDWNSKVHGEVLVFSAGCFSKDPDLQRAIDSTRFEDLVLPASLATALQDDVKHFLASRALYAEAGATWNRGMLLLGPPGNGKTHAIKALIRESRLPCIYVKSFSGRHTDPANAIPQVFERARSLAPCVVVLEDLDALIDDENRSFLLNELDGFAANEGLLTLASSNHPERLDPSLLHRPSRFDRKYRFELPDAELRRRYLARWSERLPGGVSAEALAKAVELTEGFTFAYLKEVGLSTQMQWASESGARSAAEVLLQVVQGLKEEILATPPSSAAPPARPKPRFPFPFGDF